MKKNNNNKVWMVASVERIVGLFWDRQEAERVAEEENWGAEMSGRRESFTVREWEIQ